jgi:hypothetical protein
MPLVETASWLHLKEPRWLFHSRFMIGDAQERTGAPLGLKDVDGLKVFAMTRTKLKHGSHIHPV